MTKEETLSIINSTSKTYHVMKDNYIKILELLPTSMFSQIRNVLTVKDAIIVSLKLGYVDGKFCLTESIAQFLRLKEEEMEG